MTVLRTEADLDPVAFDRGLHRTQRGERRAHDHLDAVVVLAVERYESFCTTWIASRWL
jgi:hypothetical protein